jgi:hypothetical protein
MPLPDKIPDWVKKGSVTLRNYDLRAFWFGRDIKQWGDDWPLLSRNPDEAESTADELAWELYFRDHLGGFPGSFKLYRDGVIDIWNAPDLRPEPEFDPTYSACKPAAVEPRLGE